MRYKILIYRDYGCADVHPLYKELVSYYRNEDVDVFFTDAAGIKEGILGKDVKAFFLGCGAATPYMEKLAGEANERIRSYVDRGGVCFGICAGAYYACRRIVFEKDIEALHIESRCGLNLVEGEAIGTLYKEYGLLPYSLTAFSAKIVQIRFKDHQLYSALYHGGPCFKRTDAEVVAVYELPDPDLKPAIIQKAYGRGRVILSGVHFEDGEQVLSRKIHELRCDKEAARKNADEMKLAEKNRQALFNRLLKMI